MSKVYVVLVSDCEGIHGFSLCATKEIAERELFRKRDALVAEWKNMQRLSPDDMYAEMIKNLSGSDYEKWNNYSCPNICIIEKELIEK